jgi:RHS repeat-associated protein
VSGIPAFKEFSRYQYSRFFEKFRLKRALGENGRIEDAGIGRFLSPDPHIPNRYNTRSWNRYSYVLNNPVTLSDPTGFNPWKKCTEYCPSPGYKSKYDRADFTPSSYSSKCGKAHDSQGCPVQHIFC